MPLYEYLCDDCKHPFEYLTRAGEQPVCPDCGSKKLEKQLSVPAAHSGASTGSLPMAPSGGFCGRGACGMPGCGPQ